MDKLWAGIQVAIAVLIGFWIGLPNAFKALMLLQAIDIATGMTAAALATDPKQRLSSPIATRGVRRKGLAWAVVGAVCVLQTYLATQMQVSLWGFTPATAIAAYFAIVEALSIVENAQRAGLPIPTFLSNILAQQMKKFGGEESK